MPLCGCFLRIWEFGPAGAGLETRAHRSYRSHRPYGSYARRSRVARRRRGRRVFRQYRHLAALALLCATGDTLMSMMEAMQLPEAIRELDFRAGARRKEAAAFSVRTVFWILACAACYYLATRIAWALCFPDSKVSLFFPPHAVLVSILLLVPTRHWWAYTLAAAGQSFLRHAAGALAATLCIALRGFRCRAECFGGRRDSSVHQVTVPSHHPS